MNAIAKITAVADKKKVGAKPTFENKDNIFFALKNLDGTSYHLKRVLTENGYLKRVEVPNPGARKKIGFKVTPKGQAIVNFHKPKAS